ncbi:MULTISPECIES: type II toxin-antitoxin system HicB family antitoxin [unclassified Streptomyces]|uniref:type II toxin-antitoxin system HicB family antitoxin n=1 Tax=unclassified Streptomyces TaxID=2593676 RepID=UPI001F54697A|nr:MULTISPECIES: type II toxin-antitoxin system HicB family antitoxin [unclassified Streptomyces]
MTTHKATAERQGRFWVVRVDGLPEGEQNVTQGLTWTEAQENARDLVSLVLDIEDDPALYTVDLVPADPAMFEVVREAEEADAAVQEAEKRRRVAMTRAAKTLVGLGLTQAEAGRMLGVTHQRIAQLAPKAANKNAKRRPMVA